MKARILLLSVPFMLSGLALAEAPERGGTTQNPNWTYSPAALLTVAPTAGQVDGGALNVSDLPHRSALNEPLLQACQPLFNGPGHLEGTLAVNADLNRSPLTNRSQVLSFEVSFTDQASGQNLVDINSIRGIDVLDGWQTYNVSREVPGAAKDICFRLYVYPDYLGPGETNTFFRSLKIGDLTFAFHYN